MSLTKSQRQEEYEQLLRYLKYTLHELPAGVLYDSDGANESKCAWLMKLTYELEESSKELGIDVAEFIATCRWHYEHYPHYLSRHRHFGSYKNYIAKYSGPDRG